jgi:hypothetical protein
MTTPRTLITCLAAALTALCLLLTPGVASAAVPATLTEQGRLFDEEGEPISGDLVIEFNLYAEATDGTALWTESHNVTIEDGYFSVQLGSEEPFAADTFDGTPRFLGITVGTDTEMSPRQEVSSVPYALHAGSADTASSVAWDGVSGFPTPCAAPQFLRGYNADGTPVCAAPQALTCANRYAYESAGTSAASACQAGEIATGGGCDSNGVLRSSYPYQTCSGLCLLCPYGVADGGTGSCGTPNAYSCTTTASATIYAWAVCCKLE